MPDSSTWKLHEKIRAEWQMPPVPAGYDEVTAVEEEPYRWRPDFVAWEKPGFASQDKAVPPSALPAWPWQEGFTPTAADWLAIGFFPFT
ncbi:hypothetical protein [Dyella ginsengisoli]|uniref:hypothetical protein n=1 Tax=Dyella ginsengisoli TaxID=363848 RepID=UPI00034B7CB3|nr:hypothetical protein [Dyella ginsengisoli]